MDALEVSANCAEVDPLLPGLKFTLTEMLCPAEMVFGRVNPLNVNSGFVVVAAEIVTEAVLALIVAVLLAVVPTVTFPKLKLDGEIESVPVVFVVVLALPDRATVTLAAFRADTLRVPLNVPVVLGTNLTWMLTLRPTPRFIG